MSLAFHLNESTERYTPPWLTKKVKFLLDSDCLDAASSSSANSLHGFPRIFTAEDRAEERSWNAKSVFLNPPGSMAKWWDKLVLRYENDQFQDAIFIAFTLSIFAQRHETLTRFPHWVPRKRLAYWSWLVKCPECGKLNLAKDKQCKKASCATNIEGVSPKLQQTKSPPHYSAVIYLPPKDPIIQKAKIQQFGELFKDENPPVLID